MWGFKLRGVMALCVVSLLISLSFMPLLGESSRNREVIISCYENGKEKKMKISAENVEYIVEKLNELEKTGDDILKELIFYLREKNIINLPYPAPATWRDRTGLLNLFCFIYVVDSFEGYAGALLVCPFWEALPYIIVNAGLEKFDPDTSIIGKILSLIGLVLLFNLIVPRPYILSNLFVVGILVTEAYTKGLLGEVYMGGALILLGFTGIKISTNILLGYSSVAIGLNAFY